MNDFKYKVCVRCMTYNHSNYIVDALDSFCSQQTDFHYICCIVDDASTDGAQTVIENYMKVHFEELNQGDTYVRETEYAKILFSRHKSNAHCFFMVMFLKYNHYGSHELQQKKLSYLEEWRNASQYEAICEGDDYWISTYKLKKQAEVLDSDPNVFMVYSDYITVNENKELINRPQYDYYKSLSCSGDILPTLFKTNFPLTLTVMVRPEVYKAELYVNAPASIDYLIFMSASFLGEAYYLNEQTSAYRLSPQGLMQSGSNRIKGVYDVLYPYIIMEYVKGNVKHMSMSHDIVARHNIIHKAWDLYPSMLKRIIITNPGYVLFLLTVLVDKFFHKVRSIISKANSLVI